MADQKTSLQPSCGLNQSRSRIEPPTMVSGKTIPWIFNRVSHTSASGEHKICVTYIGKQSPHATSISWNRLTITYDQSEQASWAQSRSFSDNSYRIYQELKHELPNITFVPTVTNLRLCKRKIISVAEDRTESIEYPASTEIAVPSEDCEAPKRCDRRLVLETHVEFVEQLSSFQYRVRVGGSSFIRHDIEGPEPFFMRRFRDLLSESNTSASGYVVGIVLDNTASSVKGALLNDSFRRFPETSATILGTIDEHSPEVESNLSGDQPYDSHGTSLSSTYRRDDAASGVAVVESEPSNSSLRNRLESGSFNSGRYHYYQDQSAKHLGPLAGYRMAHNEDEFDVVSDLQKYQIQLKEHYDVLRRHCSRLNGFSLPPLSNTDLPQSSPMFDPVRNQWQLPEPRVSQGKKLQKRSIRLLNSRNPSRK